MMGFWVAVVRAGNGMMKREAAMQRPRLDRWRLRLEKWKNKKNKKCERQPFGRASYRTLSFYSELS